MNAVNAVEVTEDKKPGLLARFWSWLFSTVKSVDADTDDEDRIWQSIK